MDFLIYICLIIIIGAFFFIRNFAGGYNAMIFVFLLSIFGLIFLLNDPPEVVTGTNSTLIYDNADRVINIESQFITQPLTIFNLDTTNFFALIFIAFILLAVTTIYFDRLEDMNIRE